MKMIGKTMRATPVAGYALQGHACRLWLLMFLAAFLFAACGGGRNKTVTTTSPGEELDIDKLLNTPEQEKRQAAEDAEVLRLLGIVPETAKPETTVTQPQAEPQPATADMQSEIERLQRELSEKNKQLTDLRSTLMEREMRIQELQQQSVKARTPPQDQRERFRGTDGYTQRYAQARELYEQRRYNEAITAFQALLAENDKSSYADNCQYWIGESYYGLGKYAQAIAEFEKVFTFPRSNKSDAALLKLGLCYLRLGDHQQARSEFEQLIAGYPSSPYVQYARRYLSRL